MIVTVVVIVTMNVIVTRARVSKKALFARPEDLNADECIHDDYVCHDASDCRDGSDEQNCRNVSCSRTAEGVFLRHLYVTGTTTAPVTSWAGPVPVFTSSASTGTAYPALWSLAVTTIVEITVTKTTVAQPQAVSVQTSRHTTAVLL